MRQRPSFGPGLVQAFAFALLAIALAAPAKAGLYSSDQTAITSGDIEDIDYWNMKWEMDRLEEAITSRQPEGAILVELSGNKRSIDELLVKYPNHEGIKKWSARADEVLAKIDPNANRGEGFRQGCLWNEGNYRLAYATYGAATVAAAHQHWEAAHGWQRMASQNLGFLQERLTKQDRVANWSPEFVAWIKKTGPDIDKLGVDVDKHMK